MQRRERCAQIMGDIGDQIAPLLILAGQFSPLFGDASSHLREGMAKNEDVVAGCGMDTRIGQCGGLFTVCIEIAYGLRKGA
ncbi:hypothetical protein D9M68_1002430 [compost metagenome]